MRGRILAATLAAAVSLAAPAHAAVIQDFSDFQSATNGIVLGPDGNFWVAQEFSDQGVERMTPAGQILQRFPLTGDVTSLINGPGGRVWAAVTGDDKLVWFDATSPSPTPHTISTSSAGDCGPVGMAAGGGDNRIYFTLPHAGTCATASRVATMADNGTGAISFAGSLGTAFDLVIANGKLFIPDQPGGAIRRVPLGTTLTPETVISAPAGPDGIAFDSKTGTLWMTQGNGTIARVPASQAGGGVQQISPVGGSLGTDPFGILVGADDRIYVGGNDAHTLARFTPSNSTWQFFTVVGNPWDIAQGPDSDVYFTDRSRTFVHRFLSAAPRAVTGPAGGVNPTTGSVSATVDSRGAATTVIFDYGPTTAYGATVTTSVPAALGAASVQLLVGGLSPGTTYHVRVRAGNEEGSVAGGDTTFATPPGDGDGDGVSPPLDCNDHDKNIRPGAVDTPGDKIDQNCDGKDAPFPKLAAEAHFSWGFIGSWTVLTKVSVTKLKGGETIRVTCKGKSCPLKSKTYKKVKKGSKSLTKLFKQRKLRTGTRVTVRITKTATVGTSAVLTVGKRTKDPKIKRTKVNP